MPQFDLNILNFQNVLVYIFCVSYLFYLKEINLFFFYFLKLPTQLNLYIFKFFFKKKIYVNNLLKWILSSLLLNFKKLKWLSSILFVDNNFFFYNINKCNTNNYIDYKTPFKMKKIIFFQKRLYNTCDSDKSQIIQKIERKVNLTDYRIFSIDFIIEYPVDFNFKFFFGKKHNKKKFTTEEKKIVYSIVRSNFLEYFKVIVSSDVGMSSLNIDTNSFYITVENKTSFFINVIHPKTSDLFFVAFICTFRLEKDFIIHNKKKYFFYRSFSIRYDSYYLKLISNDGNKYFYDVSCLIWTHIIYPPFYETPYGFSSEIDYNIILEKMKSKPFDLISKEELEPIVQDFIIHLYKEERLSIL